MHKRLWFTVHRCSVAQKTGEKQHQSPIFFRYFVLSTVKDAVHRKKCSALLILSSFTTRSNLLICISDLQSDQYHQSLPRVTVYVRLLRWGECVPPLHLSPPSLQSFCVPLAGQLHPGPGPVHPGWGLHLLLLGPEEAQRHPSLPTVLLIQQSDKVGLYFFLQYTRFRGILFSIFSLLERLRVSC